MTALTDVYQLTYTQRDVLIGDEEVTMDSAAKMSCGVCRGALWVRWLEVDGTDRRWFVVCPVCGPVEFVGRYYSAPRSDGSFRPARLSGSNRKASAEIIRRYGHHPKPFESVEAAREALRKEGEALASVAMVLETYQTLGGQEG